MGNSNHNETPDWDAFFEDASEQWQEAFEQNVEAQANFVEAWFDAVEDATEVDQFEEAVEGYAAAYQTWMEAAAEQGEQMNAMMLGEDVSIETLRDGWLNAANDAFKEVMSTSAFAAATADTVGSVLEIKEEVDEYAEDTLHGLRFATVGDVEEVGTRLIEVERRLQRIEEQQEAILEHLES